MRVDSEGYYIPELGHIVLYNDKWLTLLAVENQGIGQGIWECSDGVESVWIEEYKLEQRVEITRQLILRIELGEISLAGKCLQLLKLYKEHILRYGRDRELRRLCLLSLDILLKEL